MIVAFEHWHIYLEFPQVLFACLNFVLFVIDGTPHTQINKVLAHPTLPIVITAHEDRHIRFFDVNSGKLTVVVESCEVGCYLSCYKRQFPNLIVRL